MPQVLPAIGAFLGTIGTTVSFGFATGTFASMIGGALVGAAIGGFSTLITRGDLGKGLLYGALGGDTMGGLTGMTVPVTGVAGSYDMVGVVAPFTKAPVAGVAQTGGALAGGMTSGKGIAYGMAGASLIEGGLGMAGDMMQGAAQQKMYEQQSEAAASEAAKDRALQLKLAEMRAASAGAAIPPDHFAAEHAELIRQFDLQLAQRGKEHDEGMDLRYAELRKPYEEAEKQRKMSGESLEGIQFEEAGPKPTASGVYAQVVEQNKDIRGTA